MTVSREGVVRIEFPANPRYASVVRVAVTSAASVYESAPESADLSSAVSEALVLAGLDGGSTGTCSVEIRLAPAGARAIVTGPGGEIDQDTDMARLVLTGLTDGFDESKADGLVTVMFDKACASVQ